MMRLALLLTTRAWGGPQNRLSSCWNGDQQNPNHISRLRYNTMYLARILERIEQSAPEGADLTSWRY